MLPACCQSVDSSTSSSSTTMTRVCIHLLTYVLNVFTARCYASAVLAMGLCPCLSVCVRLSQAGVLLKRQSVGSQNNSTRYPSDSIFLMPKISAKFDRGHHLRGRQMQVEWVKIRDFRQITGYISKTVKDRHIVSIKVE